MPTLTLVEQIVISPAQEIANIVKLKGIQSQERQTGLVGNIITYRKQNEVLLKEMQEMHCESPKFPRPEAIETTLSVVIIGTKLSSTNTKKMIHSYTLHSLTYSYSEKDYSEKGLYRKLLYVTYYCSMTQEQQTVYG